MTADAGDARIVDQLEDLFLFALDRLRLGLGLAVDERLHVLAVRRGVGAVAHAAELVELEGPAVEADALLGVEHRAAGRELHGEGEHQHERGEQHDERPGRDDDVEGALDRSPPTLARAAMRAHHRRLEEVDEQAPAGERAQAVGDHVHRGAVPPADGDEVERLGEREAAGVDEQRAERRPAGVRALAQVLGDAGDHALLPAAVDQRDVIEALEHGETLAQRLGAVRPADDERARPCPRGTARPSTRESTRVRTTAANRKNSVNVPTTVTRDSKPIGRCSRYTTRALMAADQSMALASVSRCRARSDSSSRSYSPMA